MGLKNSTNKIEKMREFIIDGNKKNQKDIPEALKTLSSLFLFNFIYVCIALNKKVVGKIIDKRDGKWRNAILTKIFIGTFFEEPLLKSSIRSIRKKRKQLKKNIKDREIRFCFEMYLKIIGDLIIKFYY